jgi:hypothetical protein
MAQNTADWWAVVDTSTNKGSIKDEDFFTGKVAIDSEGLCPMEFVMCKKDVMEKTHLPKT